MLKGRLTALNLSKIEIIKCAGYVTLIYGVKVSLYWELSAKSYNDSIQLVHIYFKPINMKLDINTCEPIETNNKKAFSNENLDLAGYCILRLSVRTSKWNIKARGT